VDLEGQPSRRVQPDESSCEVATGLAVPDADEGVLAKRNAHEGPSAVRASASYWPPSENRFPLSVIACRPPRGSTVHGRTIKRSCWCDNCEPRRLELPMNLYEDRILPYLVHVSMRQPTFEPYRRRVVPGAEGCVLEIGVGSGLNLPFYSESAKRVIGLDPSLKLLSMAGKMTSAIARPIELLEGTAEAIPLESHTIDTVVTTWTLCSIPDIARALAEMRRVLRPEGRLLFVEHGRSPDKNVRRWQDRLTPVWRRIGGGCHLNRAISRLIEESGFRIEQVDQGYMRGPKPMTFMYEGSARCA